MIRLTHAMSGGLIVSFLTTTVVCFAQQESTTGLQWFKGNTHTHTTKSDGDSPPEVVVKWYHDHGYNFLVMTDHNLTIEVVTLNESFGKPDEFLVMQGDEVSDSFEGKAIHINALQPTTNVLPQGGKSVQETIQNNVNAIRAAGGIPHINHPNFKWSITADEIKKIQDCTLFEIYNAHPKVNNLGGGGAPSTEEIWDDILSSGKIIYGIASDDMHYMKDPWDYKAALPGRGWVMVRAKQLNATEILSALEQGNFYASTGVELDAYETTDQRISIRIKESGATKFRTLFIGKGGKVFMEALTNPATYEIQGVEMYVRAKIIDSNGKMAWTQPVILKK